MRLIHVIAFMAFLAASPAFGWWCEGHEIVAFIAERHLTPKARAAVNTLLRDYSVDVPQSFCTTVTQDLLARASTWADDVKASERTAAWHYMDIPLGLKKGDPEKFCEPIGPSNNGGQRPGCILSALRYAVNVIHSDKEPDSEKATALRYIVHLVGDLHQPLHTTTNNDRGGNCTPVQFFDDPKIANLHSAWDGLILNRELTGKKESLELVAAEIDSAYDAHRAEWIRKAPQFDRWAWEMHVIAQKVVYADLNPTPPVEAYNPKPDCEVEAGRFGALHLKIDNTYESQALPLVKEQLAKAGDRLAELLNLLFP